MRIYIYTYIFYAYSDLRDFQPELFVDALLGNDIEASNKLKARMNKMMNLTPLESPSFSSSTIGVSGTSSMDSIGSGGGDNDSAARLRASFAANTKNNDALSSSSGGVPVGTGGGVGVKRAKRAKPQQSQKKKK